MIPDDTYLARHRLRGHRIAYSGIDGKNCWLRFISGEMRWKVG